MDIRIDGKILNINNNLLIYNILPLINIKELINTSLWNYNLVDIVILLHRCDLLKQLIMLGCPIIDGNCMTAIVFHDCDCFRILLDAGYICDIEEALLELLENNMNCGCYNKLVTLFDYFTPTKKCFEMARALKNIRICSLFLMKNNKLLLL